MQKKYYDGFAVQRIIFDNTDGELMLKLLQAFADEPSAKVIEPKRGKWSKYGFCSVCGEECITEWNETGGKNMLTPFCPWCGAKMEMERSEYGET